MLEICKVYKGLLQKFLQTFSIKELLQTTVYLFSKTSVVQVTSKLSI